MRMSEGFVCLLGLLVNVLQLGFQPVAAAPQTIEVTETQKSAYQAELVGFTGGAVKILQAGQPREISLENLMRLRFVANEPARDLTASDLPVEVELRGGSKVFGSDVVSDGTKLSITTANGPYTFPTRAVVACKFRKLNATLVPQWQSFIDSQVSADMLVLMRSDEALDKIEGLIGNVTSEAVSFKVDDQTVEAPRTKLAGIKYFSTANKLGPLAGVVRDAQHNQWIVSSITSDAGQCTLKLNCGESVRIPLDSLTEIDLSYGNMRYLADIEPIERTSVPHFSLGIDLPESKKLFGPRSITRSGKSGGPSVEFVGAGAATYRVPEGFTKLVGRVELNPSGQAFVACKASVMLENKVLWEHTFETTRNAQEIALAVESGKRLRVVVESKANEPVGDIVTFGELRFMK